jgi:ABC-type nickel/cobalt efflux system permease component RcnA
MDHNPLQQLSLITPPQKKIWKNNMQWRFALVQKSVNNEIHVRTGIFTFNSKLISNRTYGQVCTQKHTHTHTHTRTHTHTHTHTQGKGRRGSAPVVRLEVGLG